MTTIWMLTMMTFIMKSRKNRMMIMMIVTMTMMVPDEDNGGDDFCLDDVHEVQDDHADDHLFLRRF